MKLIAEVSIKNRTLYLTVFQHSRHKAARITVINLIKLLCEYWVRCSTSHIKSLPDNNSTQLPMEEKDEENSMETNLDPSKKQKKTEH